MRITGARCIPAGQKVTLKDLRSSMACDLLSKGWTTDEVNYRLGHKPSSREIDKYVNFLAIDRRKPKKKLFDNQVAKLSEAVEAMKTREKLYQQRLQRLTDDIAASQEQLEDSKEQEERYEDRLDRVKRYMEAMQKEQEAMKATIRSLVDVRSRLTKEKAA